MRLKPGRLLLSLLLLLLHACSNIPERSWREAIPQKTPFIIIPSENTTLNSVVTSAYIPFLDDITSSAISLVSQVDSSATSPLPVKALVLYPGTGNQLQPIWISEAPAGFIGGLHQTFYQKFTQNEYHFKGITIYKLHIGERALFATQIHDLLLLSESSLGIEDAIRSYLDLQTAAGLEDMPLAPGSLVMNTPSLDRWAVQLAKIMYRPYIKDAFRGIGPALLSISRRESEEAAGLDFSGSIPLKEVPKSNLVASFTEENAPLELDRYISSNAAAFGIFRLTPRLAPPATVPDTSRLDSVLMTDKIRYSKFAKSLGPQFALVMYAESGFLSTGEHLFLRKLTDRSELQAQLNSLVNDGLVQRRDGVYLIQSRVLSQLIGSELSGFKDFYLDLTGDVVVISQRKGLAEVVASDRSRRRVIYYEQTYRDIRERFPNEISGLFIANPDFHSFLQPFLGPGNYVDVLTSKFDVLTLSTQLNSAKDQLAFNLRTYKTGQSNEPYQEKWLFPTGGAELSGKPILADIGGSSRDEIIFSTQNGSVYALAADGTVVLQVNTGIDTPIGSPVVYDWYGTNQNVILVAAGNKVYGWNDTGSALPKFPFELNEKIMTPLLVEDIDRNGLPEAVVATADRKLHALDGRGTNLSGWPLTTNAVIKNKPLVDYFQGAYSVLAFSENAIHTWFPDGISRNNFPKFVNASLNGSPVIYDNTILGGAADGYLYAIGKEKMFADSLNVFSTTSDSSGIGAVYVSNSALMGTPYVQNLTVKTDSEIYSGPMILTLSSNGSVFLLSKDGQLRFTKSMGQPSAQGFSPFITDINNNGKSDVLSLANFGRLYAWEILDGQRIYALPTTGMKYPAVQDIDGDGYVELIAQTQEGLRCWTIYGTE